MGYRIGGPVIHFDDETTRIWHQGFDANAMRNEIRFQLPVGQVVDQRQLIRHEAGPLVDDKQQCERCGVVLVDYRHPLTNEDGSRFMPPANTTGYPLGFVWQFGLTLMALKRSPPARYKWISCRQKTMQFAR